MDTNTVAETSQIPFILFLFCWVGAIGMVVSTCKWIWLNRHENPSAGTLKFQNILMQIYIFLACIVFSLGYAFYNFVFGGEGARTVSIIPEICILTGISFFFYRHLKRSTLPVGKGFLLEIKNIFVWVSVCALGWALTVGLGFLMYYVVYFLSSNNTDFMVIVIFVTGFLWNAPILILHSYFKKRNVDATTLRSLRAHLLLVPVIVAYFLLMLPFMLQQTMGAIKTQEATNEKPLRKT